MKKLALLFCLFLVFVACGKDKTIEKIIYGDNPTYNERPVILEKADFDKVSVLKSFNSTDDFLNYLRQCSDNRTNLLGKKFKIKGTFNFNGSNFIALNEKHYFCYLTTIENTSDFRMTIYFADSDINNRPPEQLEAELTFIVYNCVYNDDYAKISSYSYDLRN